MAVILGNVYQCGRALTILKCFFMSADLLEAEWKGANRAKKELGCEVKAPGRSNSQRTVEWSVARRWRVPCLDFNWRDAPALTTTLTIVGTDERRCLWASSGFGRLANKRNLLKKYLSVYLYNFSNTYCASVSDKQLLAVAVLPSYLLQSRVTKSLLAWSAALTVAWQLK